VVVADETVDDGKVSFWTARVFENFSQFPATSEFLAMRTTPLVSRRAVDQMS